MNDECLRCRHKQHAVLCGYRWPAWGLNTCVCRNRPSTVPASWWVDVVDADEDPIEWVGEVDEHEHIDGSGEGGCRCRFTHEGWVNTLCPRHQGDDES